jgi:hypothetical protein
MGNPISDDEVGRRLRAASDVLGVEPGETVVGNTAIEAARQALVILGAGLDEAVAPTPQPAP